MFRPIKERCGDPGEVLFAFLTKKLPPRLLSGLVRTGPHLQSSRQEFSWEVALFGVGKHGKSKGNPRCDFLF